MLFLFFKQKTAYEMRISDWSSDVCSSDLVRANKSAHLYDYDDLMAVVRPGLEGICLSMPMGPEDVALCAAIVAEAEDRNGVASGSVRLLPALETPRSLQLAYEIAQDRKSTRLNSSHYCASRMPSSA